jgi:hypothetical protein
MDDKLLEKKFNEKWESFCRFELMEFEARELFYIKKLDIFCFLTKSDWLKVKIINKDLKNKLIDVAVIK